MMEINEITEKILCHFDEGEISLLELFYVISPSSK